MWCCAYDQYITIEEILQTCNDAYTGKGFVGSGKIWIEIISDTSGAGGMLKRMHHIKKAFPKVFGVRFYFSCDCNEITAAYKVNQTFT